MGAAGPARKPERLYKILGRQHKWWESGRGACGGIELSE